MYDYDISKYARTLESSLENPGTTNAIWGAVGAMLGIYITIACVIVILQLIAMWKIFTKAGQKGWKSIIPIYNLVILYRIIGITYNGESKPFKQNVSSEKINKSILTAKIKLSDGSTVDANVVYE